ncbi:hypothetical protein [Pseudomonas fluorescens]|uniref:hypothetical protein n=1 Tax=Pseudomonas fluorescens TaxID=294 RepID=UPI00372D2CBE
MGHSEYFYFIDPRAGVDGVEWGASTRAQAEQLARTKGYSGPVHIRITAYPRKPSQAVLDERSMRERCGYADDELTW